MEFLQRMLPKRLSSRLWLITLPSAIVSFERRSDVPRLPVGRARYAGLLLIAAGAVVGLQAMRRTDEPQSGYEYPGAASRRGAATTGGLMVLGGVALLVRSLMLALYSVGLLVATGTGRLTVEEPSAATLLGRDNDD